MDRRSLLKKFGIIAAVATVAPVTLAQIAKDRIYPPDAPMWFAQKDKIATKTYYGAIEPGRPDIYVALYNRDKELFGGGYERQPVRFAVPHGGACSNAEAVIFPTATSNWGKITHMAILEHKDGPTLFRGPLTTAVNVYGPEGPECDPGCQHTGDVFKFLAGDIDIDLNDGGHGIMSTGLAKRILKHLLWGDRF